MRLRGDFTGVIAPLIKSVVFLAATAVATAVLAASITDTSGGSRVGYSATFTDVTGLNKGDSVRIAGVRVGQVDGISVTAHRLAKVKFSVDSGRSLPASVTAAVKYLNLVGQRYLDLGQGAGSVPGQTLAHGDSIPLSRTTPALSLTALFNGFQPLMVALSPQDVNQLSGEIIQVLQGEGGTVDQLLATVGQLTSTLAGKDQVIGQLVTNLNSVLGTINSRDGQLVALITTLRQLTSGLAADRGTIGNATVGIANLTTSTAGLLQAGRQPLKDSIGGLRRLAGDLNQNQPIVERFLQQLPGRQASIIRLGSYGSWLNFYQCEVQVYGITEADGRPPPIGIPITAARCMK